MKINTKKPMSFITSVWHNKYLIIAILIFYWMLIVFSYILKKEKQPVPPVDVMIVFDTTGSMQYAIDGMINASSDFAARLAMTGTEYRIGVVSFGGYNEDNVIRDVCPLAGDVNNTRKFLGGLEAEGGGFEDQIYALDFALRQRYRPNTRKIFILITDEDIGGSEENNGRKITISEHSVDSLIKTLIDSEINVYIIACYTKEYKTIANDTGGKYYNISNTSDFSEIIRTIGEDISNSLTR